jgi:hypothetical protein
MSAPAQAAAAVLDSLQKYQLLRDRHLPPGYYRLPAHVQPTPTGSTRPWAIPSWSMLLLGRQDTVQFELKPFITVTAAPGGGVVFKLGCLIGDNAILLQALPARYLHHPLFIPGQARLWNTSASWAHDSRFCGSGQPGAGHGPVKLRDDPLTQIELAGVVQL